MKIDMKQPILDKNDAIARELRERFAEHHVYVVDLLASPGSGKTSTILATIDALRDEFNIAVIEGDIASSVDAEKIKAQGIAAGEQPTRTESEAAASSEPEDSASGTEQSAASSSETPAEKKQQEAACEAEVKALIQQTYALKAIAEKGLNSSISAAKAEYKTLPAEQQTKTKKIMICLSKTGELTSLQSYCDKEMGRIVSQLRTVLKENGQSTELADQVMSTYKAEKSQRYAELKNKLYNG